MGQTARKVKRPVQAGCVRVPVIMQMEALECGAACLAMVLAYYGKWVPLEQVRADCGVSRDGSNARNMVRAARSYGLIAKGCRFEPDTLRRQGSFPCITHWNFNHFVVLDGFKGDKALLNDPAKGSYAVSMETFDQSFTGICLLFEPGADFQPGGKPKSVFAFARKRLDGAGAAVAFMLLTTFITSLIGIIYSVFSHIFLDRLLTGENVGWLGGFTLALVLFGAVRLVVEWIRAVYSLRINGKLAIVGSTSFMWKVLHLPMDTNPERVYENVRTGMKEQFGFEVSEPLGFSNTYVLAVTEETARTYGLTTLSQLVQQAPSLRLGATTSFLIREDLLPRLKAEHGVQFKDERGLDGNVRYQAILSGEVEVTDAYETDALLMKSGLLCLEDDMEFFPPYQCVNVIRGDVYERYPELREVLPLLDNAISTEEMREMNYKVDVEGMTTQEVAHEFLVEKGLV